MATSNGTVRRTCITNSVW